MFPRSWISFGVLHGIAVMLILVRWMAPLRPWLWPLGALAIVLPLLWRDEVFNGPWLRWIGLVTRKPVTEDYVPVLPWLGVMLWGMAAGQWLQALPARLAARRDAARRARPGAAGTLVAQLLHGPSTGADRPGDGGGGAAALTPSCGAVTSRATL